MSERDLTTYLRGFAAELVRSAAALRKEGCVEAAEGTAYGADLVDRAADHIDRLEARVAELEGNLPRTADGVRVVPMTDFVWSPEFDGSMTVWGNGNCSPTVNTKLGTWRVEHCYSTRKAAEAAAKEMNDA